MVKTWAAEQCVAKRSERIGSLLNNPHFGDSWQEEFTKTVSAPFTKMVPSFAMPKEKYPNGLKQALDDRQMTQTELARTTHVSVQQIGKLFHGEREMTAFWAERLAPPLHVSPEQLVFPSLRRVRAPIYSWVSAGKLTHHEGMTKADIKRYMLLDGLPKGDWFILEVQGDSMNKIAPDGSLICVNRADREPINDRFYVCLEPSEGVTFKRYRAGAPPKLLAYSTAEYDPIIITEGFVVVGRVGRVIKDV